MLKLITGSVLSLMALTTTTQSDFEVTDRDAYHPKCELQALYPGRTCDYSFNRMILIVNALALDNAGGSYKITNTDTDNMLLFSTRTDASGVSVQNVEMHFNDTPDGCLVFGGSIFEVGVEDAGADYDDHYRNYCNIWTPWTYADTFVDLEVYYFCQTVPEQPQVSCFLPGL